MPTRAACSSCSTTSSRTRSSSRPRAAGSRSGSAATGAAVLEVCDTGMGFTVEEASRVFERFYRADNAIEGQVQGTGLGLFIAQAITEAHGGTISAVAARRRRCGLQDRAALRRNGDDRAMSAVILVADDDDDILLLVTTRLRRDGHEVVSASRGDDALALAREIKPALAVLDVGMPGPRRDRGARADPRRRDACRNAGAPPDGEGAGVGRPARLRRRRRRVREEAVLARRALDAREGAARAADRPSSDVVGYGVL